MACAHFALGVAAWQARDAATARPHLEASRHAFDALGSPSWAARAVLVLGRVARDAGDYPAAARRYAEAEALARPTGDGWILGHILWQPGGARAPGGRLPARPPAPGGSAGGAPCAPRPAGDRGGAGGAGVGGAGRGGRGHGARARLTEALAVLRDAGYVWGVPPHLRELAQVAEAQGHPERAARLWGAAAAQRQALVGRPLPADRGRSSPRPPRPSAPSWATPPSTPPGPRARR